MSQSPQAFRVFEEIGPLLAKDHLVPLGVLEEKGEVRASYRADKETILHLLYDSTRGCRLEVQRGGKLTARKPLVVPASGTDLYTMLFGDAEGLWDGMLEADWVHAEAPLFYVQPREIAKVFDDYATIARAQGKISRFALQDARDFETRAAITDFDEQSLTVFGCYALRETPVVAEVRGYPTLDAGAGMHVGVTIYNEPALRRLLTVDHWEHAAADSSALYAHSVLLVKRSPEAVGLLIDGCARLGDAPQRLTEKLREWQYLR